MNANKSVFLVGSALVEDSVSSLNSDDLRVIKSVSRQSLISSMSIPWPYDPIFLSDARIKKWQRRMLYEDFQSSLPSQIHEHSLETDLILMDLVDERFGVYKDSSGNIVTDSVFLKNLKSYPELLNGFSKVPFGTDLHFELWSESVEEFSQFILSLGLEKKVVIVKNYWATLTTEGALIDSALIKGDPQRMNLLFDRYFTFIQNKTRFKIIEIPMDLCRADLSHKWGKSFINYEKRAYQFVADRILSILGVSRV